MNRIIVAAGCLVITVLGCVGFGILMFIGAVATGAVEDAALACDGQPVPGALPSGTTPSETLAFSRQDSGRWIYAGHELPPRWSSPSTASGASLVFCFEPEALTEIETCNYDSGAIVRRRAPTRRVRAVDPATGSTLRESNLTGSLPDACPEILLNTGVFHYDGTAPGQTEFVAAMGDLVH